MAGFTPLAVPPMLSPRGGPSQPDGFPHEQLSSRNMRSDVPAQRPPRARTEQRLRSRTSSEQHSLRPNELANGHGPMPMRSGLNGNGHARHPQSQALANGFEGPRSPPNSKNTSHVPCKFFRQGTCQAGKACPFSHSLDPASAQAPCKYFAKGNCKFGAKCALAHILPDGRCVNRPHGGVTTGNFGFGARINPEPYPIPPSALANSLHHAHPSLTAVGNLYHFASPDDYLAGPALMTGQFDVVPTIDTGYISPRPESNYGSPRDDSRFPLSPIIKGRSALDAPLPASFDSNGVSWIARTGPVAASVPSKFGLESLATHFREVPPSDALRTLHDSAYGNGDRSRLHHLASSPPMGTGESSAPRLMHSQRYAKPKTLSASLPREGTSEDWDGAFAFEEDFIPNSLQELLTPQEKMRRFSRSGPDDDSASLRVNVGGGVGTPGEPSSKVGSPLASSPSRFGPLFARQKKEEEHSGLGNGFGHVGSPLRNSLLTSTAASSPGLRPINRHQTPGDLSPHFASPPRQSSTSILSQQLQRNRLSNKAEGLGGESGLLPSSAKQAVNNAVGRLDRVVSSSSIGNGRPVSSIDEESGEVFSME
ncbi:MAG: hypothetical protein M1826_002768 [Phylliscum demangeonii]|nr:MAG: hypothetical protein M1826_002768 [Phylliscum demangeonii]